MSNAEFAEMYEQEMKTRILAQAVRRILWWQELLRRGEAGNYPVKSCRVDKFAYEFVMDPFKFLSNPDYDSTDSEDQVNSLHFRQRASRNAAFRRMRPRRRRYPPPPPPSSVSSDSFASDRARASVRVQRHAVPVRNRNELRNWNQVRNWNWTVENSSTDIMAEDTSASLTDESHFPLSESSNN